MSYIILKDYLFNCASSSAIFFSSSATAGVLGAASAIAAAL